MSGNDRPDRDLRSLSRREREIMESLYRRGRATVEDIRSDLIRTPTDSAVRATLHLLSKKGWVESSAMDGARKVYTPTAARGEIAGSATRHLIETFFEGSRERAVAAILRSSETGLSDGEAARLIAVLEEAAGDEASEDSE